MDACQTLVEQAAVTGVEAAFAKARAADQRSALASAENYPGNTQRAPDRALGVDNKRGEELAAMREDLKVAREGRQKAEVEAAQLGVEVEALRRTRDDLHQRSGMAQAPAAASPPRSVPRTPPNRQG